MRQLDERDDFRRSWLPPTPPTLAAIRETIDAIPWSHGEGVVHPGRPNPNPNPLPPTPRAEPRPWRTRDEWLAWKREKDRQTAELYRQTDERTVERTATPLDVQTSYASVARRPSWSVQKTIPTSRVDSLVSVYAFSRPWIRSVLLAKAKRWILRGELSADDAARLVAELERLT